MKSKNVALNSEFASHAFGNNLASLCLFREGIGENRNPNLPSSGKSKSQAVIHFTDFKAPGRGIIIIISSSVRVKGWHLLNRIGRVWTEARKPSNVHPKTAVFQMQFARRNDNV